MSSSYRLEDCHLVTTGSVCLGSTETFKGSGILQYTCRSILFCVNIPETSLILQFAAISQKRPILSVRIVVCDHYLTKPTPGIDVIYSEFRGSDIKQVCLKGYFYYNTM